MVAAGGTGVEGVGPAGAVASAGREAASLSIRARPATGGCGIVGV
jgi:hypothetical protein